MQREDDSKPRTYARSRQRRQNDPTSVVSRSNRLINAGMVEFSSRGYGGARVDVIARRAKVNKQLLYYYFKSKSGLYIATLERAYLRFRGSEKAIREATSGVNARTALHNLVGHLFRRSTEFLQFQRLLQDVNLHGNSNHLHRVTGVREAYATLIDVIEDILKRGVAEGCFRSGINAKEFYISLAGVISARIANAATLSYVLDVNLLDKDYAARSHKYAIDLLLNGITRVKPRVK
jgi:TetR/AcrR family transcriptional regulator